jgi:hypothetical protein
MISQKRDKITKFAPDVESLILTSPYAKNSRIYSGHTRLYSMGGNNSKFILNEVRSSIPLKTFKDKNNISSINSPTAYSRNYQEAIESFPVSKFNDRRGQRPKTAGVLRQKVAENFSVNSKKNNDVYGAMAA